MEKTVSDAIEYRRSVRIFKEINLDTARSFIVLLMRA